MKKLGDNLPPGGAALCILIRKMTTDKVLAGLKDFAGKGTVLRTSLTGEQEAKLKDALASQAGPASAPVSRS